MTMMEETDFLEEYDQRVRGELRGIHRRRQSYYAITAKSQESMHHHFDHHHRRRHRDCNLVSESWWMISISHEVLVYDEKGRLKAVKELDVEELNLSVGANNLRISADFGDGDDIKLEGYVRLEDKVETIVTQ